MSRRTAWTHSLTCPYLKQRKRKDVTNDSVLLGNDDLPPILMLYLVPAQHAAQYIQSIENYTDILKFCPIFLSTVLPPRGVTVSYYNKYDQLFLQLALSPRLLQVVDTAQVEHHVSRLAEVHLRKRAITISRWVPASRRMLPKH